MKEGVRGEEGAERKIKMVFPPFSFVLESYRVSGLVGFGQLLTVAEHHHLGAAEVQIHKAYCKQFPGQQFRRKTR